MSTRPHSREMAPGYADTIGKLLSLGIELRSIAAHAEVSESTLRRVRSGQPVVRATARSIELAVDALAARHLAPADAAPAG